MINKDLITPKERILTYIAVRLFSKAIFPDPGQTFYTQAKEVNEGDIVYCQSSGIHDFTFAILVQKGTEFGTWVLKDLITDRLCNMSNESFYKLPFEIPSYIFLSGIELKIYKKCIKACDYFNRYKDIEFKDGICKLLLREPFEDSVSKTIEFKYSSKTTIKEIKQFIMFEAERQSR